MAGWDWMNGNGVPLLWLVLVVLVPFAVLSGLPLAYRWERTLLTLVNAVLAVYAVAVSVGAASLLVGYALGALSQLSG